VQIEKN